MTTNSPEAQPQGELLPCPFAHKIISGVALVTWEDMESIGGRKCAQVQCYDCYGAGENFCLSVSEHGADTGRVAEERAVRAWNTRADLPRATADGLVTDLQRELAFHFGAYHDQLGHNLDAAHCRENSCEYIKKLIRSTPRATGETTVEAALAELEMLFPGRMIKISVSDFATTRWWAITAGFEYKGAAIDDCMAQVRAAARREGEGR